MDGVNSTLSSLYKVRVSRSHSMIGPAMEIMRLFLMVRSPMACLHRQARKDGSIREVEVGCLLGYCFVGIGCRFISFSVKGCQVSDACNFYTEGALYTS